MSDSAPTSLSRRAFLGSALAGGLASALDRPAFAAPGGAERCLIVWLDGGPSQQETFDPKPGGKTRAISTAVKGLELAEYFPGLAKRAQRLAVLRALSSKEGDHARGSYALHTGYAPNATLSHPMLGSLLSAELKAKPRVPAFVSLGAIRHSAIGPGFLGAAHGPYVLGGQGAAGGAALGLGAPRGNAAKQRARRRELLALLERPFTQTRNLGPGRLEATARADALLGGPFRQALELKGESASARKAYGGAHPGPALLRARRLLECGVRCVEVVHGGWDDHAQLWKRLPGRARALDRGLSALLDDLAARKLLDSTLVLVLGEFGRTPAVNARGGRDHFPQAFSALLAGGGLRTGKAVGRTNAAGTQIEGAATRVPDLFATLLTRLGLDPKKTRYAGERPVRLVDQGTPIRALL